MKNLTFLKRVLWLLIPLLTLFNIVTWGSPAPANTTLWAETWTSATCSNGSSGQSSANPDDNCSTSKGTTIYGGASISYTQSNNTNVYCRNENTGGGTAPELFIKASNTWTITGISTGEAEDLTLTYKSNKSPTVAVSTTEKGKSPSITGSAKNYTITTDGASTITLVFSASENSRVDDVSLKVKTAGGGGSTPTISTSSTMTTFGCNMTTGVPTVQNFSVSGSNLSANLTITPPSGYEICLTSGGTYQTSAISLTPSTGTVSSTTIYVRLKDTNAAGSYSGNISCASTGATTQNVAISGSTPFTVTWKANSTTVATTYVTYASGEGTAIGTLPTDPDPDDYSCTGKAFYGWYDGASYSHASTAPSVVSTSTKITTDKTFNAVFADASAGAGGYEYIGDDEVLEEDETYIFVSSKSAGTAYAIKASDLPSTNSTAAGVSVTVTSAGGKIKVATVNTNLEFLCTSHTSDWDDLEEVAHSGRLLVINGNGLGYAETGKSWYDADGLQGCNSKCNKYYDVYHNGSEFTHAEGAASRVYAFKKLSITYTNFATTCCTKLGSINGSINLTTDGCGAGELKATWKMLATTGIASQTLRVYDENLEEVTAKRITSITASTSNQTKTISGLNPCKEYYVTVENVSSGGEYCAPGDPWESDVVTTLGYTYTITKNNVSLKGGESEAARACEDFMAEYVANTGYALPTTISVSGASAYEWEGGVLSIEKANVTGNVSVTISATCVSPVITADPADANYYVGDAPTALSVTATLASGTRTYLWKVSTNGGSTWSDAAGTNNAATYSGASLSTASAGTLKFKCIVGNSEGGCTVESGVATITVTAASYFVNGETVFIQADSKDYSAWKDDACVKAWFNNNWSGGSAETTYWLFDATDTDAGKKLFATVVPASGDLNIVQLQRFAGNCSDKWNDNGSVNKASSNGVNTFRSYGSADNNVAWNGSSTILYLYGSQNSWESSLGTFADQGAGVWTATISNYTPDATSKDYKIKTSYNNGWIGNTGSNNNATLSDMKVGSTYNITATMDVKDHSLTMSKTFVKGTVHFNLQGHGLAISDLTNVAAGSKISAPSEPSATGWTFGGWFTDAECTDEWTFASDEVNETMTLYAKWTANVYTITKTLANVSNTGLPTSFTYTGTTTTALNSPFTVDATNFFLPSSIAVTMGGTPLTAGTDYTYNNSTGAFTFDKIITGNIVITATAAAKLKSIAITTQPTTRKYFAGESFSSTGAVVTATMGDGSTKTVSATWTPSGALSAGTGQTVTASYTENGITKTATTTIDVYSVTVNKKNEDGDAIDVAGVTATWTVGTKALAAGVGSTKYAFKEWQVTGATPASTTSSSTTLSSPTANVVVNAVFYKPRVIKWSVNGNDSYNTGSPTTTVAYNGTISTIPTAPSGLVCASTFVAWTDAAHNNGTTAKASTSYYESKLFTAANQFPNITAETTTFYAVFAEGTGAAVNTVMWSEDWTGATYSDGSTGMDAAKPSAQGSHTGKTVYGSATVTYSETDAEVYARNDNTAKGAGAPELLIKANKAWTISGIPTSGAVTLTLSFTTNKSSLGTLTVATAEGGKTPTMTGSITGSSAPYYGSYTITTDGASTINITFGNTSNTRLDDIDVKVASVSLTNYVTECDANIVSVTYNANGGSTSCTNTTTDKTEDYTVCATEPTRDYYTFAGWLCSADDEVYAASATIDDAVIDADFTLTAQWTPVTYTITYNYNGGSAQVDPVPATSYTVESSDITLQTPTKGHDRFDGWYENADLSTGGVKTTIAAGSHENKIYYAKWAARHEIVFDADGATTTIYRADDEDLSASVAGQGSVPSDPSAPTACSTKVFVGWSESTIDGETDTEPGDLMKPAAGTVDEDKHYYAVWADESSTTGPVTVFEDALYGKAADGSTFSTYGDWDSFGYVYGCGTSTEGVRVSSKDNGGYLQLKANIGLASVDTIKFKIKSYGDSNGGKITLSSYSGAGTYDNGSSAVFTTTNTSSWEEKTCILRSADNTTDIRFEGSGSKYRVYLKDIKITKAGTVYTYSAYSTSCCDELVTLSTNSPANGTISFSPASPIATCDANKTVTMTITPSAGYKLSDWAVATGDGKVPASSTVPAVVTGEDNSDAQVITLMFNQHLSGDYAVSATFEQMHDEYYDYMHDNAKVGGNRTGAYSAPSRTSKTATSGEDCKTNHYKFKGWVVSTEINDDGTLKDGYTLISSGTSMTASNKIYYAVWAEEE